MNPPNRIAVFMAGALGDFILSLPALHRLRSAFPSSRIELVGTPSWLPLALESQCADITYSLEDIPIYSAFQPTLPGNHPLARFLAQYDLIVSWFGDKDGQWEKTLYQACPGRSYVWPLHKHERFQGHMSEYYLSSLSFLGPLHHKSPAGTWPTSDGLRTGSGSTLGEGRLQRKRTYLCVHPGSGSKSKNWPQENFLETARWVAEQKNMDVIVLLGPAENDQKDFWGEAANKWLSVIADLPLLETLPVLSKASLYVGNDSGITHLAASIGIPTVAIFGPSDPARWAPLGPQVEVLHKKVPSPTPRDGFPSPCEPGAPPAIISVTEVVEALLKHLSLNEDKIIDSCP